MTTSTAVGAPSQSARTINSREGRELESRNRRVAEMTLRSTACRLSARQHAACHHCARRQTHTPSPARVAGRRPRAGLVPAVEPTNTRRLRAAGPRTASAPPASRARRCSMRTAAARAAQIASARTARPTPGGATVSATDALLAITCRRPSGQPPPASSFSARLGHTRMTPTAPPLAKRALLAPTVLQGRPRAPAAPSAPWTTIPTLPRSASRVVPATRYRISSPSAPARTLRALKGVLATTPSPRLRARNARPAQP